MTPEQALITLATSLGIDITIHNTIDPGFNEEAIKILNTRLKTSYKSTTKVTEKLLAGLKKAGYTLSDITLVVNYKASEWEHNPTMKQYLRPATIFAQSNFENYLMSAKTATDKGSKMYELFKDNWS